MFWSSERRRKKDCDLRGEGLYVDHDRGAEARSGKHVWSSSLLVVLRAM
jgi:hypothetical protein